MDIRWGASYTWSKWIGLCCDANGDNQPAIAIPQYFNLNRSVMPGDITNVFNLSTLLDSPFGRNKSLLTDGIAAAITGGWQLNAILGLHTGLPFSVSAGRHLSQCTRQHAACRPGEGAGRNAPTASAPIPGSIPLHSPGVTEARFGTASFDSLRGPGVRGSRLGLVPQLHSQGRIFAANSGGGRSTQPTLLISQTRMALWAMGRSGKSTRSILEAD